jgi:hypothetical protein
LLIRLILIFIHILCLVREIVKINIITVIIILLNLQPNIYGVFNDKNNNNYFHESMSNWFAEEYIINIIEIIRFAMRIVSANMYIDIEVRLDSKLCF